MVYTYIMIIYFCGSHLFFFDYENLSVKSAYMPGGLSISPVTGGDRVIPFFFFSEIRVTVVEYVNITGGKKKKGVIFMREKS